MKNPRFPIKNSAVKKLRARRRFCKRHRARCFLFPFLTPYNTPRAISISSKIAAASYTKCGQGRFS